MNYTVHQPLKYARQNIAERRHPCKIDTPSFLKIIWGDIQLLNQPKKDTMHTECPMDDIESFLG